MPRIKHRTIRSVVPKRRRALRIDRAPDMVQPTAEHLSQRAAALGISIGLSCDVRTRRLVWDATVELEAAVDALAVYRATGVLQPRQERAGRFYAMGRRSTFGGVYPFSVTLARMVAASAPQGLEQLLEAENWDTLTAEDREERQERIEQTYREADRMLLRRCGAPIRAVVRVVCVDGERVHRRHEWQLVEGLEALAGHWRMADDG